MAYKIVKTDSYQRDLDGVVDNHHVTVAIFGDIDRLCGLAAHLRNSSSIFQVTDRDNSRQDEYEDGGAEDEGDE